MRHRLAGRKFGREADHRNAMLRNLVRSLVEHGRLTTTVEKAKEMRSMAERCITYAKEDSIHHRRMAFIILGSRDLVKKLFTEIAPRYTERNGGYTRIVKNGYRKGDAAAMAIIEFVEGEHEKKKDHISAKDLTKDTAKPKARVKAKEHAKETVKAEEHPKETAKTKAPAKEKVKAKETVKEAIKAEEPVEEVMKAEEPVEEVVKTEEPVDDTVQAIEPETDTTKEKDLTE
jgi:large subunit ribosomal protein L17